MNYVSADNIGRNVGERWLFRNLTFGILQGEKVAIIGANGTGKSSLLDVVAGLVPADEGVLSVRKDIKLGYLNQQPEFDKEATVLETILYADSPASKAVRAYERAVDAQDEAAIAAAMEQLTALHAWDFEAKVKQILGKLGIQEFDSRMGQLSGGQQKRVALARVLLEEPDFLVLDEPTNHLDLASIEWLEGYLSSANITLLLVTHDRYFLDKVCNRILELANQQIFKYSGGYHYFLEKKAERQEMEAATQDKLKQQLRKELEWMRRQPKARTSKAQYRIDAFYDLKERATGVKIEDKVEISVKTERMGRKIMEIQHISHGYSGKSLIKEFSYTFKRGDKIAIVGPNGVGKSTLLGILTNEIKPDMGRVTHGETITVGYYRQDGLDFTDDQKVIDVIRDVAEFVKLGDGREMTASGLLTMFLFPPKTQHNYVHKLSGGEKRRLQLLKILMKSPNFLILDEPTNDLDIDTLNVLEGYLQSFGGVLLVVSHDRYFVDNIVEHVFAFEGNGVIKDFPGNYTDYRNWKDEQDKETERVKIAAEPPTKQWRNEEAADKKKLSYKEQKEFESLEVEMDEMNARITAIEEQLSGQIADYEQITILGDELQSLKNQVEEKEFRWLELSERL